MAGGRSDDETDRKIVAARKRFGHDREHLDAGNSRQASACTTGRYAFVGVLRVPHGFKTIPPNPIARMGDLKSETGIRNILKDFSGGIGITNRIVDGRVGRRGDDAENDSLVFFRRQFFRRHFRNRQEHEKREERDCRPKRRKRPGAH